MRKNLFSFMPLRIRFAENAGDSAGAGSTENTAGENGATAGSTDDSTDNDKNKEEGKERLFTQADLDRIVKDRLAQDRRTRGAKPADSQPADPADIEKKISSAVEDALAETKAQSNAALVREAVKAAAAAAGFTDPSIASILLAADPKNPLSQVEVTDFTADAAKVAELVEDLANSKPFLVSQDGKPAPVPGVGATGTTSSTSNVQPGVPRLAAAYGAKK